MSRSLPAAARFLTAVAVMAVIFLLSHQQGDDLPPLFPHFDKIAHFLIYGLLAATLVGGFPPDLRRRRPWLVVVTVLLCLGYGLSDEYHQSFIPGREPSLVDVLFDVLGALAVSLVWLLLAGKSHK